MTSSKEIGSQWSVNMVAISREGHGDSSSGESDLDLSFSCSFSDDTADESEEMFLTGAAGRVFNIRPYSNEPRAKPQKLALSASAPIRPAQEDQSWRLPSLDWY